MTFFDCLIKTYYFYKVFKTVLVFFSVCYAWVFFRASNITEAFTISYKLFFDWNGYLYLGASSVTFILCLILIALLFFVQVLQSKGSVSLNFSSSKVHPILQLLWYVSLLLAISLLGISSNSFIYFQF